MKANELRLGNKVMKGDMIHTVHGLDSFGMVHLDPIKNKPREYCNYLEGVPLTAEWLERFGFTKIKNALAPNAYTMDGFTGRGGTYFDFQCDDDGVAVAMTDDMLCIPHVKYVHQLQNLYFALTGTELELTKA